MEDLNIILGRFGVSLEDKQIEQLQAHYDLLMRWKAVHNLTTIHDEHKIVLYHYIDSILGLTKIRPIPEETYELGSGAGFPGLVAAVLWPEQKIVLVETSQKKCSFLTLAAAAMGLKNVTVLNKRVEDLRDIEFAMTRAAFSPGKWEVLEQAMAPGGKIAFWLSDATAEGKNTNWVLDKRSYYELEPGHKRQIAVFVPRGT